jgi:hypothetical protein
MAGHSPMFVSPATFLVSAFCVLATPFSLVLALGLGPKPDWSRRPAVSEVLRSNEALAEAAKAVSTEGLDLTGLDCAHLDDNSNWIARRLSTPEIESPALRAVLAEEPYWAFYFFRLREPGWFIKDGPEGAWVFVRRSDLKVLGLVRG